MATPTGPRATAARSFYRVRRRKKKQDQKDFDIAGLAATPHNFGAAAASVAFPSPLTLPANVEIQVIVTTPSAGLPAGSFTFADGVRVAANRRDMAELQRISAIFGESRVLTITRDATVATGALEVYFVGPMTQRILIGIGTLT